jgi:hypothetical protein
MALETTEPSVKPAQVPLDAAMRRDNWWVKPLLTVLGLGFFALYATWRAFENAHISAGPYHSPFYSPHIQTGWRIGEWVISPAFYILIFPLSFRMTCYYYRQAYYRSFFADPIACAVPEKRGRYTGEQGFPLVLQNLHRYALYAALAFLIFLWWDAIIAFNFDGRFGIGLGSLIMVANVTLLSGYTFGCHSFRHLVGGKLDCFTCPMGADRANANVRPEYRAWSLVTFFNRNHMQWAWTSLFGVILTDAYIRLVSAQVIADPRIVF